MGRKDARRRGRRDDNRRHANPDASAQLHPPAAEVRRLAEGGATVTLSSAGHSTPGPLGTYQGGHIAAQQQAAMGLLGASNAGNPYPEMPKVSSVKPLLVSMGATGTAIPSGVIISEEYNEDFYWKDAVKIYEQMSRSEGQASAITYLLELPIRRATWSIEPFSDDPVDKEIASFVETCLFHELKRTTASGRVVTQKWDDVLRHILMMLRFGFSAFEVCWRIEDSWVKWAHFLPLLPRTVWRWWVGEDNELTGIQQWTYKGYGYRYVDIPADKLLLFVHRQEGQNYEGVSLFRAAYQHWWYKQQFYKIQAIDIERNAVPVPIITLPEGFTDDDIKLAQTILANLRVNEQMGATLPPHWTLDYGNAHGSSRGGPGSQMQPAIDHHDVMMARSALAQFVNLGSTETGAFALDASQKATLLAALQAECEYIEDVFNNDAIPRLVDYNFAGAAGYPKLKCGKVLSQDFSSVAEALSKLASNLPTPFVHADAELEDFIRNEMGLPKAPQSVIEAYNPTAQGPSDGGPGAPSDGGRGGAGDETDNGTAANTGRGQGNSSDLGDEEPGGESDGGGDGGALSEGEWDDVEPELTAKERVFLANAVQLLRPGAAEAERERGRRLLDELNASLRKRLSGQPPESAEVREARLLREALDAAARVDAVEKAMVFTGGHQPGYTQNRGPGGRWGVGDAGQGEHAGQGHGAGGGRAARAAASGASGGGGSSGEHVSEQAQRAGHAKVEAMHREAVAKRGGRKSSSKAKAEGEKASAPKPGKISYEEFKARHEALRAEIARLPHSGDDMHDPNFHARMDAQDRLFEHEYQNPRHANRLNRELHPTSATSAKAPKEPAPRAPRQSAPRNAIQNYEEFKAQHEALTAEVKSHIHEDPAQHESDFWARSEATSNLIALEGANPGHADRLYREQKTAAKGASTSGAKATKASKAPAETIHERSARLQREGHLPAEVKNFDDVQALKTNGAHEINIAAHRSVAFYKEYFGEHQLGTVLSATANAEKVGEWAKEVGVQPGRSRAETISRIVSKATEGRYSADLPKATEAPSKAEKSGARAPRAKVEKTPEQQAREQARKDLKAGKLPEESLKLVVPQGHDIGRPIDIAQHADARYLRAAFGDKQLPEALARYSHASLKGAAREVGVKPGATKTETISRISAHLGKVPYAETLRQVEHVSRRMSADFSTDRYSSAPEYRERLYREAGAE